MKKTFEQIEQILIENLTTAVAKIEAQHTKAFDVDKNRCLYIHPPTGARCLFGHCMKAPHPDTAVGISGSTPLRQVADFLGLTEDDLRPFASDLVRLQSIHDTCWEAGTSFKDTIANAPAFHREAPLVRKLEEALQ